MTPTNLIRRATGLATALGALLAAPAAPAQVVVVVDAAGGPGADATTIQDGVDLAPDGATVLVRPGAYAGFVLDGRPLVVAADGAVTVQGEARIEDLPAGTNAALLGLELLGAGAEPARITLQDDAGDVWIQSCRAETASTSAGRALVWVRSDMEAQRPVDGLLNQGTDVFVYESVVRAGPGVAGSFDGVSATPGGPGFDGFRSLGDDFALLVDVLFVGGRGGAGYTPGAGEPCSDGGPGGTGLVMTSADSLIRMQDSLLLGGQAGAAGTGCGPGAPGSPLLLDGAGITSPINVVGRGHAVLADGPVREGEVLSVQLLGEPGDTAILMISGAFAPTFVDALNGAFLLETPIVLSALFTLDAQGQLTLTSTLPELGPGVEGVVAYLSAGFVAAAGGKFLGSGSAITLLDAGL